MVKQFCVWPGFEQTHLQHSPNTLNTPTFAGAMSCIGEQQIADHRDQNLGQHRISGFTKEGFDFQILLDGFEEQLHLPAVFVCRRYRAGGQLEIVG